jgi:hypothetical protein
MDFLFREPEPRVYRYAEPSQDMAILANLSGPEVPGPRKVNRKAVAKRRAANKMARRARRT